MKSFVNKTTGVTLTPKNKWVEEQLEKDDRFEVVGAKSSKNSKDDKKSAKDKDNKDEE